MTDLPIINQVLHGDCLEILPKLPSGSVDMVFADPPYNLQLRKELWRPELSKVVGVSQEWDRFSSLKEYDEFTRAWLSDCQRILKDTGTLWVIGSYHNIFRIGTILQDLGFWILNDIIWIKHNPLPNMRGTRFCNAHETLIWAKKCDNEKKYTFHYQALKAGNEDRQMRSDWYFPICSGGERQTRNGRSAHPTQKPEGLLRRIVNASTNPGDLILDPFCGTGTTAAVAKSLGRSYITMDREESYVGLAEKRLAGVSASLLNEPMSLSESRRPRVPFIQLVESGLVPVDTKLRLKSKERIIATVHADATISANGHRGSIHKVGCLCLGTPTCNGWINWYYTDAISGEERLLDYLRSDPKVAPQSEVLDLNNTPAD
jgi:DNA modification methylase